MVGDFRGFDDLELPNGAEIIDQHIVRETPGFFVKRAARAGGAGMRHQLGQARGLKGFDRFTIRFDVEIAADDLQILRLGQLIGEAEQTPRLL